MIEDKPIGGTVNCQKHVGEIRQIQGLNVLLDFEFGLSASKNNSILPLQQP